MMRTVNNDRILQPVRNTVLSKSVTLHLTKTDILSPKICCNKSSNIKRLNRSIEIINKICSIDSIIERAFEMDRLKTILLDEDQLGLFNNSNKQSYYAYKEYILDKNMEEINKRMLSKHNISEIDKKLMMLK